MLRSFEAIINVDVDFVDVFVCVWFLVRESIVYMSLHREEFFFLFFVFFYSK